MAWNDLASNQIPTFTDLQTSGFTLNAGQSAVTSNECLTKTQALAKYNLSTSLMSSYASNQLVPKSNYASGSVTSYSINLDRYGYSTVATSCSTPPDVRTYYSSVSSVVVGTQLYLDAALAYTWGLANTLWHLEYGTGKIYQVDTNGVVLDIAFCPLSYSYILYYDYTGGGTLYNGFDLTSQACASTSNSVTVYSNSSTITSGAELFLDLYGNTPISCIVYGGGRQYYKINGNSVRFSPDPGLSFGNTIYDTASCVTGNSFQRDSVSYTGQFDCCDSGVLNSVFYSSVSTLVVGSTVYSDTSLSTVFNGSNRWWYTDTDSTGGTAIASIRINTSGVITSKIFC
jgi:hypothetical protein